jgi:hypothetical protein
MSLCLIVMKKVALGSGSSFSSVINTDILPILYILNHICICTVGKGFMFRKPDSGPGPTQFYLPSPVRVRGF